MTHDQQLDAIRLHCHDGLHEAEWLDAELPVDVCRALETVGYLGGCLDSILAECDQSTRLDAELAALDRLAKGETP